MSVLGALAAGGALAPRATLSWAIIVVLILVAAAPLIRHRRATAVAGRRSRLQPRAKIKRSEYYWRSRNLAHVPPEERISRGLPPVHREEEWE